MKTKLMLFYCILLITRTFGQNTLNDTLVKQLFVIDADDQKYRSQLDIISNTYAGDTAELSRRFNAMGKALKETDSMNLIKVVAIIDKYGWLGPEVIGEQGNITLFMVIQHADLLTQKKYLPIMREAVKNKRAAPGNLAMLEDRIAIREGRKQIYGSQISWNMKTDQYLLLPLEDPDNVDKRRAQVGLGSLAVYLSKCCNMIWNIEQYKKDNPPSPL